MEYNDYNTYLKTKYGCKVYRIGIDAGFSCPNRDRVKGAGGCIYCNKEGSRAPYANPNEGVSEQLATRINYLKEKRDAKKFIAYFQAFTNTYAPPAKLKNIYDAVLPFEEIVGISIGTRPDAIDEEKLKVISSYKNDYEVWIEYGLQSIHDKTLKALKRGHDFNAFLTALKMTKRFDIPVSVHVILGLQNETKEDMLETARKLSDLRINGVKIHLLHILRGSTLERLYMEGKVKILEQDEYVELVCDFLEHIDKSIIVQRLTGEGTRQNHIAPAWALDKIGTITKIEATLKKRGTRQGCRCG